MKIGAGVGSLADYVFWVEEGSVAAKGMDFSSLRISKHVTKLIDAGYRHIELALDTRFMLPDALDDKVIDELLEIRRSRNVSYSVHLPIQDLSFMSLNDRVRNATLACLKESIGATEPLDVTGYVLHATRFVDSEIAHLPLSWSAKRKIYKYIIDKGSSGLGELVDAAGNPKRILIEPDVDIPFDIIIDPLVNEFDTGICFDYGHHVMAKLNPYEFFDHYRERIREVHFHDVAVQYKIDHIPLGGGTTDWRTFLKFLKNKKYDRLLVLEMMEAASIVSLPRALEVLEQ